jgi:NitT/TauT family transport system ATP-binding protein
VIEINGLRKSYRRNGAPLAVLAGVSFKCEAGQVTSIVGPSGCGKTTLLNIIAQVDPQDGGSIVTAGKTGYMMQDALLLPWRTLAENGFLAAEITTGKTRENYRRLEHYLTAFDLADASDTYPHSASGGMKQRVALIRTILIQPSILLLDEPFSNLDFDIKLKIQYSLIDFQQKNQATVCLVTHDIEDAIALSHKVVILSNRPATVKTTIPINLGLRTLDPIKARKSPRFSEYFRQIWDQIKYLDGE